jgi:hypothetical protein
MKQCSKCKESKPLDQFYKWTNICKSCKLLQAKRNRLEHKEHYRRYWRQYEQNRKRRGRKPVIPVRIPISPQQIVTKKRRGEFQQDYEQVRQKLLAKQQLPEGQWEVYKDKRLAYLIADAALNEEFSKYAI